MRFEPEGLRCGLTFRIPNAAQREAADAPAAMASSH